MKNFIFVNFQKKGVHCFPDAKTNIRYNDVCYLGNIHRHLFKFKVYIEVFINDRDIEFINFLIG